MPFQPVEVQGRCLAHDQYSVNANRCHDSLITEVHNVDSLQTTPLNFKSGFSTIPPKVLSSYNLFLL